MGEDVCQCGKSPVCHEEKLISQVDAHSNLEYANEGEGEFHTPPVENNTPIPVLPPCCQ